MGFKCTNCEGKSDVPGYIDCRCGGGNRACEECRGTGKVRCPDCSGDGRVGELAGTTLYK